MATKVYVDVLLVINYIINTLLIYCTAKLTGRRPKRRRIVAAALIGSAGSLAIFLPFYGFAAILAERLVLSAAIVAAAFSWTKLRVFVKQWFVFFAVSFFFAGVMLAAWMVFRPDNMVYFNGIVYFDLSITVLLATTVAAYLLLSLFHRFSRSGRVRDLVYEVRISYGTKKVTVRGMLDTGNSLYDPFTDTPVIVCSLEAVSPLLPGAVVAAIRAKEYMRVGFARHGLPIRLIPFGSVGGGGMIPAFRADCVVLEGAVGSFRVEEAYIGLVAQPIGGGEYGALLSPDLVGIKTGTAAVPR